MIFIEKCTKKENYFLRQISSQMFRHKKIAQNDIVQFWCTYLELLKYAFEIAEIIYEERNSKMLA